VIGRRPLIITFTIIRTEALSIAYVVDIARVISGLSSTGCRMGHLSGIERRTFGVECFEVTVTSKTIIRRLKGEEVDARH